MFMMDGTGKRYQPQARIAHDCKPTMARTELYICQGNVTWLYYRDNVTQPNVLCLAPVGMGMPSFPKTTIQVT